LQNNNYEVWNLKKNINCRIRRIAAEINKREIDTIVNGVHPSMATSRVVLPVVTSLLLSPNAHYINKKLAILKNTMHLLYMISMIRCKRPHQNPPSNGLKRPLTT
jgi:hypothetical protein